MNLPRLAKVWALTTSPNQGEAAAAREQARRIVQRAGKTLADVPALLGQAAPASKPAAFAFVDIGKLEDRAAWAVQEAHRKAQRSHAEASERAASGGVPDCADRGAVADLRDVFDDLPAARLAGVMAVSLSGQAEVEQEPGVVPLVRYYSGTVLATDDVEYPVNFSFERRQEDVVVRLQIRPRR